MKPIVSCAALNILIAERADIALLDVRRRPAFESEPRALPGAVWRDPGQVGIWASELKEDRPVVVYCVHGHEVSHGVAAHLRGAGLDAAVLEGGIEAWKAFGGPIVARNRRTGHERDHAP
jgi:rhodanese-related sulfurtransferase